MQVSDDRFQTESGWNCSSILTPDSYWLHPQKIFYIHVTVHCNRFLTTASKQSQDDSAWKRSSKTCMKLISAERTVDDGQRRCPKHVEFYRIRKNQLDATGIDVYSH